MSKYVVFLRGINVSGQKLIKMETLANIFIDAGFTNVKTFIQSGNVSFESTETNPESLETNLTRLLADSLGYNVDVFLRTFEQMMQMMEHDPFSGIDENMGVKKYVTFTRQSLPASIELPLLSPAGDVELILVSGNNIFSLAHVVKDGRYGFPNGFIEKRFKIPATTRNWNTVCKIIK